MSLSKQIELLGQTTEAILSHRELLAMFQHVCQVMRKNFPQMDDFGIAEFYEKRDLVKIELTCVEEEPSNLGFKSKLEDGSPAGFLLKRHATMMINDLDAFQAQSGVEFRSAFNRPMESVIAGLLERPGEKAGGFLYITSRQKNAFKPEDREYFDTLRSLMALAVEHARSFETIQKLKEQAELEGAYLRQEIKDSYPNDGMVGTSNAWRNVIHQVSQVAQTDSTVLIQGETGTGKEVVARALHDRSLRKNKPLIKINCGALPENLVESELFGHEKGAFTGALGRRVGRFELANGGTIFLDEIGEMPLATQVKLLRVLQEREFERVGGEKPIRVDVRVIAATNRDLSKEVAAGRFRADLYYRLNVFPIAIPPLRTRPDDAVELARYFLHRITNRMGRRPMILSDESVQAIQNYSFPGNVRELEHLVERAVILSNGAVADIKALLLPNPSAAAFPDTFNPALEIPIPLAIPATVPAGGGFNLKDQFEEAERIAIEKALADCNNVVGGKNGAASRLGLKRQTLQSKMKKLGIVVKGGKEEPED
ncbi:MAG: sigma 54-interacting transcriptional regulator [Candidatus Sumerlaeia bacterium]|nr:sigma 54-interacting transcriptional regulator [Candidatus Sumerlaeia bacterium]